MKNSVLISLVSVIVFLVACAPLEPAISDSFISSVEMTGGDIDCAAEISVTPEKTKLTMTSPASVSGLSYEFSKDELKSSYSGLSCITPSDSLPDSSAPELLAEVFGNISNAEYISSKDGKDTFVIDLPEGKATLICSDGVPVKLTADYSPYTFTFKLD